MKLHFFAIILLAATAHADIKLPAILGNNMVLQHSTNARLWGWARPGEEIEIFPSWMESPIKVVADTKGNWQNFVKTPVVDNIPQAIIFKGDNEVVIENIHIGEVWVCSGQSNMEWPIRATENWEEELKTADRPAIRLFTVENTISADPQSDCRGAWLVATPDTVKNFSAVGYYFGVHVYLQTHMPIGLISADWGGTPAEAWTSRATIESLPEWSGGIKLPDPLTPHAPTSLYNGMIAPLTPLSIRGVIWYQGESNRTRAQQYRTLFPALIRDWRERWAMPDNREFPFCFVQIAPFNYGNDQGQAAELREAQMLTLSVSNTGMAVTMDIGNPKDIHPANKKDVGRRLALWALAKTYGKDITYSGPLYTSMKVEGSSIRLSFDHAAGLTSGSSPLTHFTIAGEDRNFIPAQARIDGDTILVSADSVPHPVAVRYAWGAADEPNLKNAAGLPASSFRTDDWPIGK